MVNIFFGDMLYKNFGIICYGCVIFYDYDEICLMNECNFRFLLKFDDFYVIDMFLVVFNDVFFE